MFSALLLPVACLALDPWWEAVGFDPAWLGSNSAPSSDPVQVSSESELQFRRPLRIDLSSQSALFLPETDTTSPLSFAAGLWEERSTASIRGHDWSLTGNDGRTSGFVGRLGARRCGTELSGNVRAGNGISAQSVDVSAALPGLRLDATAGFARRWSTLLISSSSGSLALPWSDVTDSGSIGITLPLGRSECMVRLWGTERASPWLSTGISDTGSSVGWSLGARSRTSHGGWSVHLEKEDLRDRTFGRWENRDFHSQTFFATRAEADLEASFDDWDGKFGSRQYRLRSPQGDLEHPTVNWNKLSDEPYAAFASILSSRRDYLSGQLLLRRWDLGIHRRWNGSGWTARAGASAYLWLCDAELDDRQLQVTSLIPAVSFDSLASGHGWFAALAPEISLSRRWPRVGRLEFSSSWRLPCTGSWTDRSNSGSGGASSSSSSKSSSLPLDPFGSWSARLSWSQ